MALLGNYSVIHKSPATFTSGLSIAQARSNSDKSGSIKNSYLHFGLLASYPDGYGAPYSWSMARTVGAMSSFTSALVNVSTTANGAGGRNLEGPMSSSLTVTNAQLDQIVSFVASSLMSLSVNAQLNAAVGLQASAVLALTTSANIQAIISTLASSSMTVSTNSVLTALAHMNAEAGGPTALSPEGLAQAVWGTFSSDYIASPGTFGYQLANSGTGLSPIDIANAVWDKDLSTLKASELVAFLEAINTKANELHKIQGLDSASPMTVTESNRVAGSITQNFTGDGISTTTVTRV